MTWANSRPLCCPHGQQTINAVNDWENHSLFSACKHFNVCHCVAPVLQLHPNHSFSISWFLFYKSKTLNLVSAHVGVELWHFFSKSIKSVFPEFQREILSNFSWSVLVWFCFVLFCFTLNQWFQSFCYSSLCEPISQVGSAVGFKCHLRSTAGTLTSLRTLINKVQACAGSVMDLLLLG